MVESFRQFASGEKFNPSARQVNAWTEAALAHRRHGKSQGTAQGTFSNVNRAAVSNGTGQDLPPFSVLQLTGPAVDPSVDENEYLNQIAFLGDECDDDGTNKFVITQNYLPDSIVDAKAIVSGVTFARLTGPVDQTNAAPKSGQTALEAGSNGPCEILFDPGPYDSERYAIVKIGLSSPRIHLARTTADHEIETAQSVEILEGEQGSETGSGMFVEAYNRYMGLVKDAVVHVSKVGQGWEITLADCEDELIDTGSSSGGV